jgi:DNA ligase D-like protein (predicted 3'-phosphoesterase)
MQKDKLQEYYAKRDLKKSPEPAGDLKASEGGPIFVIQKHDSSNLHYDFRLEVDGVLKSWAIPKGPSTNPAEKRLAIPTEDHPIEYARFEGVIPKDHYGAGEVIVWDAGSYENTSEKDGISLTMEAAVEKGHITVYLKGKKLQGGYALIKTGKGEDDRWLFMKMKDDQADARRNPTSTEPESVISGKTIEDLKKENQDD